MLKLTLLWGFGGLALPIPVTSIWVGYFLNPNSWAANSVIKEAWDAWSNKALKMYSFPDFALTFTKMVDNNTSF